jgi:Flp pilus assembly pilin Flp
MRGQSVSSPRICILESSMTSNFRLIPLRWLRKREQGQDLLEYGMLASLIAVFAIMAVRLVGNQIGNVMWSFIAATF